MYREKEYNKEFSINYFRLALALIMKVFCRHPVQIQIIIKFGTAKNVEP